MLKALDLPDLARYEVPCKNKLSSNIEPTGHYLKDVIVRNPQTFRMFCPDELESNLLGAVFEVTWRNYQWPIPSQDMNV